MLTAHELRAFGRVISKLSVVYLRCCDGSLAFHDLESSEFNKHPERERERERERATERSDPF